MISPISPQSIAPIVAPAIESNKPVGNVDFRQMLETAIQHVEGSQTAANENVKRFLNGDAEELHTAAIAVQKADLEFNMFMQVRNKVVQAYQEIMRMQV